MTDSTPRAGGTHTEGPTFDAESLRARLAAATPGPWRWDRDDEGLVSESVTDTEHGEFGSILARYPRLICTGYPCKAGTGFPDYDGPDATLIAHAPTDLVAALDRIAELEAENEQLRGALEQIGRCFGNDNFVATAGEGT